MHPLLAGIMRNNVTDAQSLLCDIQDYYTDGDNGLVSMSKLLRMKNINKPDNRIHVLLLGDSSSGKSSFVNFYCSDPDSATPYEHILETGVRSTTQTLTFVEKAEKRGTLDADSSMQHSQTARDLVNAVGDPRLRRYVVTELVPSNARCFDNIIFADTPGMLLSNAEQPFDVHRTLHWLADEWSDLILCFLSFDANSHTLDLVGELCSTPAGQSKTHFLLNRVDQVHDDYDHISLVVQTTQNLAKVLPHRFNILTTFVPQLATKPRTHNSMPLVERIVSDTVSIHAQRCLRRFEKDIDKLNGAVDVALDWHSLSTIRRSKMRVLYLLFTSTILGVLIVSGLLLGSNRYPGLPTYLTKTLGVVIGFPPVRVWGSLASIATVALAGLIGSYLLTPKVSKHRASVLEEAGAQLDELAAIAAEMRHQFVTDKKRREAEALLDSSEGI
ncbi:hypothetical protein J8273_3922 [Carpediemonas membranifera]|uniref:G domain-containing protein n=1 Tax=Carpediemonas membranifera TaxID=201153 RepID=A0A8J6B6U0_9EUKA|nr:hypothetical protein J8273_3922 [Carpediemonas membranifera]|eukprot:KAG9394289.1 hypothetical protein J8273_3922 [Carpediemonas membranifera]